MPNVKCGACWGQGWIQCPTCGGGGQKYGEQCKNCRGSGRVTCGSCQGKGFVYSTLPVHRQSESQKFYFSIRAARHDIALTKEILKNNEKVGAPLSITGG